MAIISAWVSMAGLAAAGSDEGIVLLVDRRADEVSVYFSLQASDLPAVFGKGAEEMLGPDGTVDIDALYDGTFDTADAVLTSVEVRIGGAPVPVEAMSMMLHDPAFLPPFTDPYDAQVAIAVCTSPETVRGMGLADLRAYLGYFVWRVDGRASLDLSFPKTGRAPVDVTIREFHDFHPVPSRVVSLADGGLLSLTPPEPQRPASALRIGAAIGAIVLLLAGVGYVARTRPTRSRPPRLP